jgi:hypothetical protein
MSHAAQIGYSVAYLKSPEARRSLEASCYWPKWHAPWWHMLLLHEMGETTRIPEIAITQIIAAIDRMPLKVFPIHAHEVQGGVRLDLDTGCHCQMANYYRVLAGWGVNVDKELPWIRPWLLKYQMADGGLNCDSSAYCVPDEVPSSMVGTIAAFEAILLHTRHAWSPEEVAFLERAARFLMDRKLMLGSNTRHNAEERAAAPSWMRPCFPRFYFYDVLRGLNALVLWAEHTGKRLPSESIQPVIDHLNERYPDGAVRVERCAFAGKTTFQRTASGGWRADRPAASVFPLLQAVSSVGEFSPHLSWQWQTTKRRLLDLHE